LTDYITWSESCDMPANGLYYISPQYHLAREEQAIQPI